MPTICKRWVGSRASSASTSSLLPRSDTSVSCGAGLALSPSGTAGNLSPWFSRRGANGTNAASLDPSCP